MSEQKTITLKHKKSTKGTHVYDDPREDAPIPTVYIKRGALPEDPPALIKLILEY